MSRRHEPGDGMTVQDRVIPGVEGDEPDYPANLVWNCPVCGRFQSEQSPAHKECGEAMHMDWVASERAWAEGW